MSFWDTLKPTVRLPAVVEVQLQGGRTFGLAWDDGKRTTVTARTLRQFCPCAECIDEWSGERRLDQSKVAEGMTVSEHHQVGNYALGLTFADGHRTGIFPWKLLRELSHE